MKRQISKTVNHLVDLEGCIQYLRVRLAQSGGQDSEIVDKNKRSAEESLLKKMEDLCVNKTGYGGSINLLETSQHQKRNQK